MSIHFKGTHPTTPPEKIAICMGSPSDWPTMQSTVDILDELAIPYTTHIISAHRTPDRLTIFAKTAADNGLHILIAGAGGAAHLPGMLAAHTHLPVLGVPIESNSVQNLDSLLSIVQMPGGIPVATLAIGKPGAKNAGLLAAQILSLSDDTIKNTLIAWRTAQTDNVPLTP